MKKKICVREVVRDEAGKVSPGSYNMPQKEFPKNIPKTQNGTRFLFYLHTRVSSSRPIITISTVI